MIIIATIIVNKDLRSATYMLMFNLSLADLVVSSVVNTFTVVGNSIYQFKSSLNALFKSFISGVFVSKAFFDRSPFACQLIGAICLTACVTSLLSIGFLAFNRLNIALLSLKKLHYFLICFGI